MEHSGKAVFSLNNDWGKSTNDLFTKRAKELGAEIVASQSYPDTEKDFRSAITTMRDAKPDGVILISCQPDGALIAQQLRQAGVNAPLVGSASIQSPDYTKLGGKRWKGRMFWASLTLRTRVPKFRNL